MVGLLARLAWLPLLASRRNQMDADFSSVLSAAEFALLRAALVSVYMRAVADDEQVLSVNASVSRGAGGQFDVEIEYCGQAGFGVGGVSV